ncbi:MAG: hypothetical protein OGMRLDGQ_002678, partial [Candidatus Fervidibacter sp.]
SKLAESQKTEVNKFALDGSCLVDGAHMGFGLGLPDKH